jgi:aminomuconate-semialdehyde/2-hydroxymuconate-6-semialdehyde dehydrogenase
MAAGSDHPIAMRTAPLRIANFVDGDYRAPAAARYLPVLEPATAEVFAEAPLSAAEDIDAAVAAARRAAPAWAATPPSERARILRAIANEIDARLDSLAEEESRDAGKPVATARRVDIPRAAANFRQFAAQAETMVGESFDGEAGTWNVVLRQPLGVVGCISPWNLPLYLLTWKIAPALAAGNAVVAKPSEITPISAWLLGDIVRNAGLPPGVLNIVHGAGAQAGAALVAHRDIKAVSFTGSTATGALIAQVAAPQFKKLSLELGGKNATIVFADADIDRAVDESVRAAFSNQGQICLCGSRVLVEASIWSRFRDAFVDRVRQLRIGDPRSPESDIGALVSAEHRAKVEAYIALAHDEGGRLLTGGGRPDLDGRCRNGFFIQPTVFDQLDAQCRVNQEEIFGPVVTLMPFADDAQALAFANSTAYGLAASVWTRDLDRAQRFARGLATGIVWINCWMARDLRTPFGGVKASGVGREGGLEAMRFFTEAKTVALAAV